MSVISSPVYDPVKYSEGLANDYVAGAKAANDARTAAAAATATALGTLGTALSAFQSAMSALHSNTTAITANTAVFSNTAIGTATAGADAAAGTYSFYVEKLATAGQVSYDVGDSAAVGAGSMNVMLADGSSFQVNLANADSNGDGTLTAKEVAAAINATAANNSRVTASTLTVNGQAKLVLTSAETGADNAVASIDVSGLGSASLQSQLSSGTVLTTANDAIVWVGGTNGTKVEQASNTFSVIDDVKFTITAAQATGAAPVTLTVAADKTSTATNVQTFVTAYNTLLAVFDKLSAAGDHTVIEPSTPDGVPTPTTADGPLYNDAGLSNLRDRLGAALRTATGGLSLISFGISSNKEGVLTLDTKRLDKAVAANPGKLESLFGRAGIGVDAGAMGAMNKLVSTWNSGSNSVISGRKEQNSRLQTDLAQRAVSIKSQFDSAYKRYLTQFTLLQTLQASMTNTSNMFEAMFSTSSNN
ncbi:flagellar filament capping protein FliD [Duganella aceris]|uniref:Flagellar hook-associated protein 2 n=1 Tax=Duganella aceris TaxID=2703883 RepID=A0ABX0FRX9_9BURK|nr:flagellar filament capping protein FliD [Duganella aceris]NGZ87408.1 flagellar filament capping protein FliD [Duganella aceris]